jgi:hypothetical protein
MKKFLLSFLTFTMAFAGVAQVTFFVNQPSPNVGDYDVTYADDFTTWGVSDLLDPANSVTGTLAIVQGVDSLGCDPLTNAPDINGKIAVVWRGACEFGTKAFNAQNAGAIAVVIVNHSGDPVGMAGGTDGLNVTIPVVMISTTTGALLYNEIIGGNLTAFIGNKTGLYANDLGMGQKDVLRAKQFAIPSALAQNDTEFSVQPGAWVFNYGFNDQTNVTVTCNITGSGVTTPYSEVATPVNIASGDSAFFTFPLFSQTSYPEAYYDMSYQISSDSADDFAFDNGLVTDFAVTDNVFTYSRVEPGNTSLPIANSGYFTTASFLTACVHFVDPNASRLIAKSLTFSATTSTINDNVFLDDKELEVFVLKWNDPTTDINDPNFDISNIETVHENPSSFTYTYASDLQEVMVEQGIEPFLLEDNQHYLFCVTTYDNEIYIGHDTKIDYDETILDNESPSTNGGQPATMFQTEDANGMTQWYGLGRGTDAQASIGVNFVPASELAVAENNQVDADAYPNPANENVTVLLKGFNGTANLTIVDIEGKVVFNNVVNVNDSKLMVDVSNFANGMYVFNLNQSNGKTSTFNVVVSK